MCPAKLLGLATCLQPKKWCDPWFNDKGGYGELQWTSVKGDTVYGFCREVPEEDADAIEWMVSCKMVNNDNFIYTLRNAKKTVEAAGKRIK
jgi:hypothetical protein